MAGMATWVSEPPRIWRNSPKTRKRTWPASWKIRLAPSRMPRMIPGGAAVTPRRSACQATTPITRSPAPRATRGPYLTSAPSPSPLTFILSPGGGEGRVRGERVAQEFPDTGVDDLRLLELNEVPRLLHQEKPRAGDLLRQELGVLGRGQLILLAADRERRQPDGPYAIHHVERVAGGEIPDGDLGPRPEHRHPRSVLERLGSRRAEPYGVDEGAPLGVVRRQQLEDPAKHSESRARPDQDEAGEKLRVLEGHRLSDPPAHRVAAEDDPSEPHSRDEAPHHPRVVVDPPASITLRLAVAGKVEGDDPRRVREPLELADPRERVSTGAVDQAECRRAATGLQVVDADPVNDLDGHGIARA